MTGGRNLGPQIVSRMDGLRDPQQPRLPAPPRAWRGSVGLLDPRAGGCWLTPRRSCPPGVLAPAKLRPVDHPREVRPGVHQRLGCGVGDRRGERESDRREREPQTIPRPALRCLRHGWGVRLKPDCATTATIDLDHSPSTGRPLARRSVRPVRCRIRRRRHLRRGDQRDSQRNDGRYVQSRRNTKAARLRRRRDLLMCLSASKNTTRQVRLLSVTV